MTMALLRISFLSVGLCVAALAVAGAQSHAYAPGVVIVVYGEGITIARSPFIVERSRLLELRSLEASGQLAASAIPQYTNDARTNRVLLEAGVDRSERLFAKAKLAGPAYRLHVIGETVEKALALLRALPTVKYASPDWYVSPMAQDLILGEGYDANHSAKARLRQASQRRRISSPRRSPLAAGRKER